MYNSAIANEVDNSNEPIGNDTKNHWFGIDNDVVDRIIVWW